MGDLPPALVASGAAAAVVATLAGWACCASDKSSSEQAAHAKWILERNEECRDDNGWLTLVGLHWLEATSGTKNIIGGPGSTTAMITLTPSSLPDDIGEITVTMDKDTVKKVDFNAKAKCSVSTANPADPQMTLSIGGAVELKVHQVSVRDALEPCMRYMRTNRCPPRQYVV